MKRGEPLKRNKGLDRGTSELKRTRLQPMSKKRRSEAAERRAVVAEAHARDGGRCVAADLVPHVTCWGPLDGDEIVKRSARPGGHLDAANVQGLCRAHHSWKDDHPIDAARVGLRPFPVGYMGDRTVTTSSHVTSCPRTGANDVGDTFTHDGDDTPHGST